MAKDAGQGEWDCIRFGLKEREKAEGRLALADAPTTAASSRRRRCGLPVMTNGTQLKELRATAAAVAQKKAATDDKRDEPLSEAGKVIDQAVAAVRPALPALVLRVPSLGLKPNGPGGEGAVKEHPFVQLKGADVRSVHLASKHTSVEGPAQPKAQGGKLRGRGL